MCTFYTFTLHTWCLWNVHLWHCSTRIIMLVYRCVFLSVIRECSYICATFIQRVMTWSDVFRVSVCLVGEPCSLSKSWVYSAICYGDEQKFGQNNDSCFTVTFYVLAETPPLGQLLWILAFGIWYCWRDQTRQILCQWFRSSEMKQSTHRTPVATCDYFRS